MGGKDAAIVLADCDLPRTVAGHHALGAHATRARPAAPSRSRTSTSASPTPSSRACARAWTRLRVGRGARRRAAREPAAVRRRRRARRRRAARRARSWCAAARRPDGRLGYPPTILDRCNDRDDGRARRDVRPGARRRARAGRRRGHPPGRTRRATAWARRSGRATSPAPSASPSGSTWASSTSTTTPSPAPSRRCRGAARARPASASRTAPEALATFVRPRDDRRRPRRARPSSSGCRTTTRCASSATSSPTRSSCASTRAWKLPLAHAQARSRTSAAPFFGATAFRLQPRSAMRSAARVAIAMMVSCGFTPRGPRTVLPSTMKRPGTSCAAWSSVDDARLRVACPCGTCRAGGSSSTRSRPGRASPSRNASRSRGPRGAGARSTNG